ncbi:F-box/FBD/LRR-repeat protein At1g13570-like [Vicia villosa]|uniref:F-box/FBD/LRR-repeat protein At1g13570-like n=1 Tax=Vicia villosa TaxID=3911 RepID=UPI00273CE346|nr:F-box/FBD/LRR-repeat protein At1g13570-like [Vicia villosa]
MRTSRKKKKKKANQNDRISDLPINVIDEILGNLRIRDQVRTSILSKMWRYMWTSAPQLRFDQDFFESFLHHEDYEPEDYQPVVSKIITDVLMIHNGPIHKFSIDISPGYPFRISMENLNTWIPFMSKDIKHLELLALRSYEDETQTSDILFSCKELTFLKLSSIFLSIPPNFNGFKKLLELHLFRIEFESGAIESLVSGCPLLEKLKIKSCDGCDYLVISSPSLKVLVLELYDTKSICLKEAKNLIDFTLKTNPTRGLIKSLPKIKKFSLDNWIKESYADIILPPLLTSSFSSLEYLELDDLSLNDEGDFLYFVSVLKSSPRLIELVIRQRLKDVDAIQVSDHCKELECGNCFLKLQTVNIHVSTNSQHGMSLIQFILANSPSLKTLNFWCDFELDTPMLLNISKDLLRMERASPKAQVAFFHLKGVVLL